jgi:uncharacterized membrane protein YfcA
LRVNGVRVLCLALIAFSILMIAGPAAFAGEPGDHPPTEPDVPWWVWPVSLFLLCLVLGVVAVMAGVGGGVLYVPIVSGFFPIHLDFVRGTGLLVALAGALAAGPGLLRRNLASLRLTLPVALIASASSIGGALLGLYLSALDPDLVRICLGATITGIAILFVVSGGAGERSVFRQDRVGIALRLSGIYWDYGMRKRVEWKTHRTLPGLLLFIVIGILAGMFGLGAGWANVPVLNLVMGVPLKVSIATSKFLLSITDTSAAWIYINRGCVLPLITVPSMLGLMLGSFIGVKLLTIARPKLIRIMVIGVLFFAGLKSIDKGLGWGILG